jgi:hypothetical protein
MLSGVKQTQVRIYNLERSTTGLRSQTIDISDHSVEEFILLSDLAVESF